MHISPVFWKKEKQTFILLAQILPARRKKYCTFYDLGFTFLVQTSKLGNTSRAFFLLLLLSPPSFLSWTRSKSQCELCAVSFQFLSAQFTGWNLQSWTYRPLPETAAFFLLDLLNYQSLFLVRVTFFFAFHPTLLTHKFRRTWDILV